MDRLVGARSGIGLFGLFSCIAPDQGSGCTVRSLTGRVEALRSPAKSGPRPDEGRQFDLRPSPVPGRTGGGAPISGQVRSPTGRSLGSPFGWESSASASWSDCFACYLPKDLGPKRRLAMTVPLLFLTNVPPPFSSNHFTVPSAKSASICEISVYM